MAEWRISDEVPLRELDGLDHERCATLHNYIVELGWTQRGLALDTLDRRTWWQCYGGDAALASTAERLNPSVVSFLKAAWQGFAMDSASNPHLFHRYLGGLSTPEQLCRAIEYTEEEEDSNEPRYVLLYMANGALGTTHPLGLVLNQSEATAMQHMSIRDTEITMNGRQLWLPLEVILDGLVDMIEQGKILAVDATYSGEQERTEPWIMPSYTDRDLEESLQAFQQLVDAIHDRMPSKPQCRKSFAHQFLAQCTRPAFSHIAPGLSIAQNQPFAPASGQADTNTLFPFLLFASTSPAHQQSRRAPWGEQVRDSPFALNFNHISSYLSGLYLSESDPHGPHPFEDGCKLVLPFTLGSNAFARTSDGALIGEHVRREGDEAAEIELKSAELYQLGYNHFIAAHDVQLKYVLGRWLEMVEEGKWDVDEHWAEYQMLMSW